MKGEEASHKSSCFMKQQAGILFSSKVLEKMDGLTSFLALCSLQLDPSLQQRLAAMTKQGGLCLGNDWTAH